MAYEMKKTKHPQDGEVMHESEDGTLTCIQSTGGFSLPSLHEPNSIRTSWGTTARLKLTQTGEELDVELWVQPLARRSDSDPADKWHRDARHWMVTLSTYKPGNSVDRQEASWQYSQGRAHVDPPRHPDVLASLVMDADIGNMSLQEYCDSFGTDEHPVRIESVRLACKDTFRRLARIIPERFWPIMQDY